MSRKLPKVAVVVADWQECVCAALKDAGLNETLADELAEDAVNAIIDQYAGQQIYIPTSLRKRMTKEHEAIYADHLAGMAHADIATKHNKSMPWVYAIIRTLNAECARTATLDMFGDGDEEAKRPAFHSRLKPRLFKSKL